MMFDRRSVLTIIDFDKCRYGDPWEEFKSIVWSVQNAPAFASGIVDGYFAERVPTEFWRLLMLYVCVNMLGSLLWAIPFGESEVRVMRNQAAQVLDWYDAMRSIVPAWYRPGGI